jgi:long-chain fatty acid transport protein
VFILENHTAKNRWRDSAARSCGVLTAFVLNLVSGPCTASNGLNLIGFGAESIGMGGADLAVARDTSALNTNPAGLTQIEDRLLNNTAAVIYARDVSHEDGFGNNEQVANNPMGLASFGYADRITGSPLVWGIGLFAQGGAGVDYENINSPFGTSDDLSSLLRIAKLSSGLAWAVSDALSLGATLELVYSDLNQEVFPNTSFVNPANPDNAFFGYKLQDMNDFAPGLRLGMRYRLNERVSLGMAYTPKTELALDGGTMNVDMSAIGLGKVRYRDVRAKGIDQPQELGAGIAVQFTNALLLSLEVDWLDWSAAVHRSELRAKNPNNPSAPRHLDLTSELNWRDQYVFAVGVAYDLNPRTVIRCGYNYGRNPIPDEHLSPLLAPINQHHLTLGGGYQLSRTWRLDGALEYDLPETVSYNNHDLPFGPGASESSEIVSLYVELGGRW